MAMTVNLLMAFQGFQMCEYLHAPGPLLLQILFDLRRQGVGGC